MSEGKILSRDMNPIFHWEVDVSCFPSELPVGKYFSSPIFTTILTYKNSEKKFKNKWQLQLYPNGNIEASKDYISLYQLSLSENEVTINSSFSLLTTNDEKVLIRTVKSHCFKPNLEWGFSKCFEKKFIFDPKNNILKDDKLTIRYEINFLKRTTEKNREENLLTETLCRLQEFDKFEKLFADPEFSDVTIIAQKKTFHLHKCILASCSDAFAAMFKSEMKEKSQNSVEIVDTRSEVLEKFFEFVYTGKVNDLLTVDGELLTVAEKYQVKKLKVLCEEKMCNNLSNSNALDYFELAALNGADKLKERASNWISLHLEDFVQKPEFKEFGIKRSESLLEMMMYRLSIQD